MSKQAFQDYYPEELSHCYGCGSNNADGHQLKSYWLDEEEGETVAYFTPKACHTAIPGFVYGGLIASLIDCHGTGSACAAAYRAEGRALGSVPALRFVTGALNVNFLAPTPLGVELKLHGKITEIKERKVIVEITLSASDVVCVSGSVIAVKMPATME
ncbi:PaaI family thioesterase [Neptunomonas sp.]|uniref:PaaI family thioesterase n=1 Tax=Neptunomonas sp. TaxID=1971898 RepID=UPI0025F3581A|nr:PaaI family thioesterase [Neptunomonas sp.]